MAQLLPDYDLKARYVLPLLVANLLFAYYAEPTHGKVWIGIVLVFFVGLAAFYLITLLVCLLLHQRLHDTLKPFKMVLLKLYAFLTITLFVASVNAYSEHHISEQHTFDIVGCVMEVHDSHYKGNNNSITVNTPEEPELHIITHSDAIIEQLDEKRGECLTFTVYRHSFILPNIGTTNLVSIGGNE